MLGQASSEELSCKLHVVEERLEVPVGLSEKRQVVAAQKSLFTEVSKGARESERPGSCLSDVDVGKKEEKDGMRRKRLDLCGGRDQMQGSLGAPREVK